MNISYEARIRSLFKKYHIVLNKPLNRKHHQSSNSISITKSKIKPFLIISEKNPTGTKVIRRRNNTNIQPHNKSCSSRADKNCLKRKTQTKSTVDYSKSTESCSSKETFQLTKAKDFGINTIFGTYGISCCNLSKRKLVVKEKKDNIKIHNHNKKIFSNKYLVNAIDKSNVLDSMFPDIFACGKGKKRVNVSVQDITNNVPKIQGRNTDRYFANSIPYKYYQRIKETNLNDK